MNICFLVELEKGCYINSAQDLLVTRIVNSLEYFKYNYKDDENKSIVIIDNSNIIIEVGQSKDNNRIYIINIVGISDEDKNKLLSKLKNDEVFRNIIILYDYLSNYTLMSQYEELTKFEILIRLYFSFCIIDRYNVEYFEILNKFNTKDILRRDNDNVFNKLYSISLEKIINFINENKLGGKEYQLYLDAFKLGDLTKVLNDDIFVNSKILDKSGQVNVFRNAICHNRILNCKEYKNKYIDPFLQKMDLVTKEVEKMLSKKFNYDTEELNESIIFFIQYNFKNFDKEFPIIINKIINSLGFSFDINNLKINQFIATYEAINSQGIDIDFKAEMDEEGKEGIVYVYLKYSKTNESLYESSNFLEILLDNISEEYKLVVLKDSASITYNIDLYKDFNYLENILRAYLTSIYFGIETNLSNNHRSQLKGDISVEINKINRNIFYELDFYDLLQMITRPKGGYQISTLSKKLRELWEENKKEEIEALLQDTVEINEDIKIIINNTEELYKYRTMVAHSYIITKKEYDRIKVLINDCKIIIENIFLQYIKEKYIFKNKDEISISGKSEKFEIIKKDKVYELQVKYLVDNKPKVYCFLDLSAFNLYKIIRMIILNEEFNQYNFILTDACVNYKIENELKNFSKDINEQDIIEICNKIPFNEKNKFVEINTQEAELEKEIGILLRKIEDRYSEKIELPI